MLGISALGVMALSVLSIIANITGILDFLGAVPPFTFSETTTPAMISNDVAETVPPSPNIKENPLTISSTPTKYVVLRIDSDYQLQPPPARILLTQEMSPESLWQAILSLGFGELMSDSRLMSAGDTIGFEIGITSLSTFEWIQLAPKMLIRIDKYEDENLPRVDAMGVCGFGGGSYDYLNVEFPIEDIQDGIVIETDKSTEFDYYSLEPGERLVVYVEVTPLRPGRYEFSVGGEYWFGGAREIEWTSNTFKMTIVSEYRLYDWGYGCTTTDYLSISECVYAPVDKERLYQCTYSQYKP